MLEIVHFFKHKEYPLRDAQGDEAFFVLKGPLIVRRFAYSPIEGLPLPPIEKRSYGRFSFIFLKAEEPAQIYASDNHVKALVWKKDRARDTGYWDERPAKLGEQFFEYEGGTIKASRDAKVAVYKKDVK